MALLAKHKINQPYRSITEFQAKTGLTWPKSEDWRLTPYAFIGEINGIPGSRGLLVATNGILCYIEQLNDKQEPIHFLGHVEFFVCDDVEVVVRRDIIEGKKESARTAKIAAQVAVMLEAYA